MPTFGNALASYVSNGRISGRQEKKPVELHIPAYPKTENDIQRCMTDHQLPLLLLFDL